MKKKRRNFVTESCLTAGDERGDKEEITVYSIKLVATAVQLKVLNFKIQSLFLFSTLTP